MHSQPPFSAKFFLTSLPLPEFSSEKSSQIETVPSKEAAARINLTPHGVGAKATDLTDLVAPHRNVATMAQEDDDESEEQVVDPVFFHNLTEGSGIPQAVARIEPSRDQAHDQTGGRLWTEGRIMVSSDIVTSASIESKLLGDATLGWAGRGGLSVATHSNDDINGESGDGFFHKLQQVK